jgi:hypothetical protein
MILALDNDRTVKTAEKVAARVGLLNPSIDRAVTTERRGHMGICAVDLADRVADELLKTVFTFCKLLRPPAAEVAWREALTKCRDHDS